MGLFNPEDQNKQLADRIMSQGIPSEFVANKEDLEPTMSAKEHLTLQSRTAEQVNPVVSLFHNGFGDWNKSDPNFNPYEYVKDTEYANYPDYFINTDNVDELNAAKKQVDELKQYQELASRAPSTAFWSSMAWGMADPMLAVPYVGTLKLFKNTKNSIDVAKTAMVGAAGTTAGLGVSEAALQASQPSRTKEDTALTLAAGSIMGAAFGGVGAKLYKPSIARTISEQPLETVHDFNMEGRTTPLVKQYMKENPPEQLRSVAEDMADFDARMAKSAQDSESAVKQILEIADDSIKGDTVKAKFNISDDEYKSLEERLSDIENKYEEVKPIALEATSPVDKAKLDKELEEYLAPKGGTLEEVDAQNISAGHVSYDARVMGLPDQVLKAAAIPHISNPSLEGLASPSATVRDFTTRLGYMHLPLKGADDIQKAAPISLESSMQQDLLKTLDFNKAMDDGFYKYLQIEPESRTAAIQATIKSRFGGKTLTSKEFDELTMDAMNANDTHVIPEIQERAKYSRNLVNERYKAMQEVGLIDKEKPPLQSWFKVVYDIDAIIKDRIGLENTLTKQFLLKQKAQVEYTKGDKTFMEDAILDTRTNKVSWEPKDGEVVKSIRVMGPMDMESAREAASDAVDNILRMGDKALSLGDIDRLSFTRGTDSARPRQIILDEEDYQNIKPWLVKDFRKIMQTYLASTSRAINYKKLLNDLGVDSLQDVRLRIRDEFKAKMYKINNIKEKTEEEIAKLPKSEQKNYITKDKKAKMIEKLNKQAISSEKLFNDLSAIGLGQFKKRTAADPFFRTVNQYNVARLFGGILISALGDPAAAFIKNSIPRAIWRGWVSQLKQFASGTSKLKKQDYRNALTAIQNEMDDLTRFLMNPDMTVYGTGPIERGSQVAANAGMKISGMTTWNNFWQKVSHNLTEYNILDYTSKPWEKLTKKQQGYLLEIGIDEAMAKRIWEMANPDGKYKYGQNVNGTYIANSHMWRDTEAAARFNNAIRVEVHKSPVITEMLDIPRFFQRSELRKSMILGKGYSFAAINKLALSAASRHDAKALQGIMSLVFAGMAVQVIKDKMAGRQVDYKLNTLILDGMDKSGVLGMLADPLFQMRYGQKSLEKYGTKAWITEPIDYILGPNASILNPAYRGIMAKVAGQPIDKKTEYQLKSLIPYSKLWWLPKSDKK